MSKKIIAVILTAVLAGIGIYIYAQNQTNPVPETVQSNPPEDSSQQPEVQEFDKTKYSIDEPGSVWLIVNKQRPIDLTYVPTDLVDVDVPKRTDKSPEELMLRQEPAQALIALFQDAAENNINLLLGSAYRSAELQATYYNNYVANFGQAEADRFSAKPGTSEHQTGLSADLSGVDRTCYLEVCFSDTPEGKWLAENAHKHGFIIRYPEGKEAITGYQYEPWHIRYVGTELAQELFDEQQTMEEFFNL